MRTAKAVAWRTAIYSAVLLFYILVLYALGITCPIYAIFGFECPTCGVTRALVSLAKFDLAAYMSYNALALPLVLSVWYMINADLFEHRRIGTALSLATLAVNFVLYIVEALI